MTINSNVLINEINKILQDIYPIEKTTFKNISDMSHFGIYSIYENNLCLPFKFNINGKILTGKYKSYQIIQVNNYSYVKYLKLYLSFINIQRFPYVSSNFLFFLHMKNKIDVLNIDKITVKYKNKESIINIEYQSKPLIKYNIIKEIKIINKENHFYFSSFEIENNKEQIRKELMRLFIHRNEYTSIHIHLENNGGGDSSPGQLLIKTLCGNNKEEWMKDVKKITRQNGKNMTNEWDSWNEYENKIGNYRRIQLLDIPFVPIYDTKYTGKIHLYMNEYNGSAAWYTITYLIYAFGLKIERFTKECFGKTLKFGTISKDSQLVLHGRSSCCSGDGNPTTGKTNIDNIIIRCPTLQFYNRSFDEIDWTRFWIDDPNNLEM